MRMISWNWCAARHLCPLVTLSHPQHLYYNSTDRNTRFTFRGTGFLTAAQWSSDIYCEVGAGHDGDTSAPTDSGFNRVHNDTLLTSLTRLEPIFDLYCETLKYLYQASMENPGWPVTSQEVSFRFKVTLFRLYREMMAFVVTKHTYVNLTHTCLVIRHDESNTTVLIKLSERNKAVSITPRPASRRGWSHY